MDWKGDIVRKPIIAGNWKMNKTLAEAEEFIQAVKNNIPANDVVDAVVGAPNNYSQKLVEWKEENDLKDDAQIFYYKDEGAFTEKSCHKVLAYLRTDYVIIGHPER